LSLFSPSEKEWQLKVPALPFCLLSSLIFVTCTAKMTVPKTENMKYLKRYARLTVKKNQNGSWTDAGVTVERNDKLLILASGTVKRYSHDYGSIIQKGPTALSVKIGDSHPVAYQNKFYRTVKRPGKVKFMFSHLFSGSFRVDIFIIAKEKEIYLHDILTDFMIQNPEDRTFKAQLDQLYLTDIDDLKDKSTSELQEIWINTISSSLRTNIVWEFEKMNSIESLIKCLSTFDKRPGEFAEFWSSDDVSNLIDIFKSIKRLGAPQAIRPVSKYVDNPKYELRWHALDTLGAIRAPESVDAIAVALHDPDEQIRLKAIQSLESVGHRNAIRPLSTSLADNKEGVRVRTEKALKKLGASEGQILNWKKRRE
jgi:hypothetical protein